MIIISTIVVKIGIIKIKNKTTKIIQVFNFIDQ